MTRKHAVVLLPRVGAVAGAVQVQDHVVRRHHSEIDWMRGPADDQVDHHDDLSRAPWRTRRAGRSASIVPAVTFR